MIITFDIETLPCADPALIADIHAKVTPPGTFKKADSIAKWWQEEGEQAKAEAVAKTSFDGMYGRIACICYQIDDGDVIACSVADEVDTINDFFGAIVDASSRPLHGTEMMMPVTFCGHNVAGFDLPFLKHRAIINGIKPPAQLFKAMSAKPWDACVADTMLMWSSDPNKRGSMDRLCKAFGIAGKDGFDGSMVAETWPTDPLKVIEYCCDDVRRTRAIYKRLTFTH